MAINKYIHGSAAIDIDGSHDINIDSEANLKRVGITSNSSWDQFWVTLGLFGSLRDQCDKRVVGCRGGSG